MKKLIIMMILLTSLLACTPAATVGVAQSDKARMENPPVDVTDQTALAGGNGTFAVDLYQQLRQADDNLFFSPYSISAALAMTYAGASGTTADAMAAAVHFDLTQDKLHPAFNWLEQQLNSRGDAEDEEAFRLSVANAIWGQQDYKFLDAFLDTLAVNYGAGLRILNFAETEESRIKINDWVSGQTEERIPELLAPGAITPDTVLVLTNAIYFKAAWKYKFMEKNTAELPFYLLDGSSVTVPMMRQTMLFGYAEGGYCQAVELDYKGEELSMVILLPDEGKFAEFEDNLDYATVAALITRMKTGNIQLTLPKFGVESEFSLKETLSAMGMGDAFSPEQADFSGMTGSRDLWLDNVVHQAFVTVDESGTEAAAATAAVMVASLPGTVTVDRPFIFLVRDKATGAILFMGRVLNPAKG